MESIVKEILVVEKFKFVCKGKGKNVFE